MTGISEDEVKVLQRDVQRLLGRCMLRLQQYERQIKRLVAHGALSATADNTGTAQDARVAEVAKQTLGQLIGEFLGSHLVSGEPKAVPEKAAHGSDHPATVSFQIRLGLSEADYAHAARDLTDLKDLRNNLVHHFIDQHDLGSVEGCRGAQAALIAAYDRIDQSFGLLLGWAQSMEHTRLAFAEFAQTHAFRDAVINGTIPDEAAE